MAKSWEELHEDLLEAIIQGLPIEGFLTLSSVCSTWNSVAVRKGYNNKKTIPWLMLPSKGGTASRGFYNLASGKIHDVFFPEAMEKRCMSSLGWIMTIDKDLKVGMVNPFRRDRDAIELPSLHDFPNITATGMKFVFFIRKFVLSASPTSNDYKVMVLRDTKKKFSFWKPGDSHWTNIKWDGGANFDLIFYGGQFLAIGSHGEIIACNIEGPDPPHASVVLEMPYGLLRNDLFNKRLYLVDSEGSLLLVSREGRQQHLEEEEYTEEEDGEADYGPDVNEYDWVYDDDGDDEDGTSDEYGEAVDGDDGLYFEIDSSDEDDTLTEGFQVFEIDVKRKKWTELKSLRNTCLFIGQNSSFSVRVTHDSPGGISPNCIYFADDNQIMYLGRKEGGGKDMGVYRMEDGVIEKHFMGCCQVSPPLWLEPDLF